MASVNKVILIGNLGRDPEVRYTPSGSAVCNLNLATTRNWKNRESGERQEETEWHRVVLYDRQAEIAGEYLKKGRQVYIEGSLRTDKYTDKDGVERFSTDIIAAEMQMLGGGTEGGAAGSGGGNFQRAQGGGGGGGQQRQGGGNYGGGQARGGDNFGGAPRGGDNFGNQQRQPAAPAQNNSFDDDDIPF